MIWSKRWIRTVMKHILFCALAAALLVSLLCFVQYYEIDSSNAINAIGYFGTLIVAPLALLITLWKNRPGRWYMLCVFVLIVSFGCYAYCSQYQKIDRDFANYLTEDTSFQRVAAEFMPDADEFSAAENIDYIHMSDRSGCELIYVASNYTEDTFSASALWSTLSEPLSSHAGAPYYCKQQEDFLLNGHEYQCWDIAIDGRYYAMVFSKCLDSRSVKVLFFTHDNLSSIAIPDVLRTLDLEKYLS